MDRVEQLIQVFGADRGQRQTVWKLDVLLDLEQIRDPRIIPFCIRVLNDPREPKEVRIRVLKRLRNGNLRLHERPRVAGAITLLLSASSTTDLRVQAALALSELVEINGVVATLGSLVLDPAELLELRYPAFTSLERAGPTPECLSLLRAMLEDETVGRLARRLVEAWRVG